MRYNLIILALIAPIWLSAQFTPPDLLRREEIAAAAKIQLVDLDGDGYTDILYAAQRPALAWYRNTGGSTFSRAIVIEEGPSNSSLRFFAKDMDFDGDADIFAFDVDSIHTSLVYWQNDFGGFEPGTPIPNPLQGPSIVSQHLEDVDDDGDMDVVIDSLGSFFVLRNSNNTSFEAELIRDHLNGLFMIDVDGDGHNDLLYTSFQQNDSVFVRYAIGNGTWEPQQFLFTHRVGSVHAGDSDLDGEVDLWFEGIDGLGIFHGNGPRSFDPVPDLLDVGIYSDAQLQYVLDVDGNGYPDLVCLDTPFNVVLLNTGTNSLTPSVSAYLTGRIGAIGDVTGDGAPEVLRLTTNNLAWLDLITEPFNTSATNVTQLSTIVQLVGIQSVDETCDGVDDLVNRGIQGTSTTYRFNGTGLGLAAEPVVDAYLGPYPTKYSDWNGDGFVDRLYLTGSTLRVGINDGSGVFTLSTLYMDSIVLTNFAIGDLDNDGLEDLVIGRYNSVDQSRDVSWLKNMGLGVFQHQGFFDWWSGEAAMYIEDTNGDGQLDVLYSNDNNQSVQFRNNGSGNFVYAGGLDGTIRAVLDGRAFISASDGIRVTYGSNFNSSLYLPGVQGDVIKLKDMDGDGNENLVFLDRSTGQLGYHIGPMWYGGHTVTIFHGMDQPLDIALPDINADGRPDIALLGDRKIVLLTNLTNSQFQIQGKVFYDESGSGVPSSPIIGLPNIQITASPAASLALSGDDGEFTVFATEGQFEVDVFSVPSGWSVSTSAQSVALTSMDPVVQDILIGLSPDSLYSDLLPSFVSSPTRCNTEISQWVSVLNRGTAIDSGIVRMELDPLFGLLSANPAPDSISGQILFWHFTDLYPNNTFRIHLVVQPPGLAQIGALLVNSIDVSSASPLNTAGIVEIEWSSTFTCSFDPNDKQVIPVGYGQAHAVALSTDLFDYTVRFQNTGNDTASTVMIVDPLSTLLDPTSIQILGASHQLSGVSINDNLDIVFRFDDILLPDSATDPAGSQGYVRFQVRTSTQPEHLDHIANTAQIYFDQNPPIITNTVHNLFVDCASFFVAPPTLVLDSLIAGLGDSYLWFLNGSPIASETGRSIFVSTNGTYSVEVLNTYGCYVMSPEVEISSVGIKESGAEHMMINPNPSRDRVTLVTQHPLRSYDRIELLDVQGRVMQNWKGSGSSATLLEYGSLSTGVYFLRVHRMEGTLNCIRLLIH